MAKIRSGRRLLHRHAVRPEPGGQLVGLGADRVEEILVGHALPGQVHLDPFDRVEQLPVLLLVGHPVPGRIVGGGVRVHPVGEGLDHHRAVAGAALLQRPPGDGQAGHDVVAVDPHTREAVARSTAPTAAPATASPPVRRWPTGCSGSRRRPARRTPRRTPCPRARRPGWSRRHRRRRWWPRCVSAFRAVGPGRPPIAPSNRCPIAYPVALSTWLPMTIV